MLQELYIVFEVHQEYAGAKERIQLGTVRLNLAEYAGLGNETRRYLMQDSKINSTVKISVEMHQVGGDTYFNTPPLKGAQVFSGIAGILGDQRDEDSRRRIPGTPMDNRSSDGRLDVPSMNPKNRETGATQDMYRRTLAASWQMVPGELNADECIEDIFAGGDGWTGGTVHGKKLAKSVIFDPGRRGGSDSDSVSQISAGGASTPTTVGTNNDKVSRSSASASLLAVEPIKDGRGKRKGYALSVMTGRSRLMGGTRSSSSSVHPVHPVEVDEYEARDDLVSWRMPGSKLHGTNR